MIRQSKTFYYVKFSMKNFIIENFSYNFILIKFYELFKR